LNAEGNANARWHSHWHFLEQKRTWNGNHSAHCAGLTTSDVRMIMELSYRSVPIGFLPEWGEQRTAKICSMHAEAAGPDLTVM